IYNGTVRKNIARLNPNGSLDQTFTASAHGDVHEIAIQPDGKLLVAGYLNAVNGVQQNRIARLNTDGSLDSTFNLAGEPLPSVDAVALQLDGKILIGGYFHSVDGNSRNGIARLESNGQVDPSFNPGTGCTSVGGITLQSDGKALITGTFETYNGIPRTHIARIDQAGNLDTTFIPPTLGYVTTSTLQPDGKVLIGVNTQVSEYVWNYEVIRLNPDGSRSPDLNSGTGFDNSLLQVMALPNGKFLVGGNFQAYNGVPHNRIARIYGNDSQGIINVNVNLDNFGSETTWELRQVDDSLVASGGPYADETPGIITEQVVVGNGCYTFELFDAGNNGIDGGGYVITDGLNRRIIDANGEFGATSSMGTRFCLPVGDVKLSVNWCDRTNVAPNSTLSCNTISGGTAYQFWLYDPHGSYSQRVTRNNNQITPGIVSQIPTGIALNMRVRAKVEGTFTDFGPACKIMVEGPGMKPEQSQLKSLKAAANAQLRIMPNPSNGERVQLLLNGLDEELQSAELKVYDALGNVVMSMPLPVSYGSVDAILDMGELTDGIYLAQVIADGRTYSQRVVVSR
ncbi:MAG: T9SS type A sorting domain-containing protein, partial [Flavobacteriales bacterium]